MTHKVTVRHGTVEQPVLPPKSSNLASPLQSHHLKGRNMVEREVHRVKDEITRELKDMVEEENAQLKTFSIFHRASKLPVDPFKWGEKGGDQTGH